MKRRIASLFLVLMLLSSLAITTHATEIALIEDGNSVYDEANLLTASEEDEIAEVLEDVSAAYETQLVIVTVPELDSSIDYFAEGLYDTMGFGYGDSYDGVLLIVCMDPRECSILCNGSAANIITPDTRDQILDAVASYLSDGDHAEAFLTFAEECEYYLDGSSVNSAASTYPDNGNRERSEFTFGSTLLFSMVVGIVAGLIVVAILAGQLKSVKKQNQARDYVKAGSMHLTERSDIFLYRNVSRVKRDSGSSSSGSRSGSGSRSRSSSRHVGSRKF